MSLKVYRCCICHEVLKDDKPIRLVKQKYGHGNYNQYSTVCHYDFCSKCYATFHKWIKKHNEKK